MPSIFLVTFCTEKEFALYGYETGPQNNTKGNLIRWLTHEQGTVVKNISGYRDFTDRPQHSLVTHVLREMH